MQSSSRNVGALDKGMRGTMDKHVVATFTGRFVLTIPTHHVFDFLTWRDVPSMLLAGGAQ
jgi:hypothetical protein